MKPMSETQGTKRKFFFDRHAPLKAILGRVRYLREKKGFWVRIWKWKFDSPKNPSEVDSRSRLHLWIMPIKGIVSQFDHVCHTLKTVIFF